MSARVNDRIDRRRHSGTRERHVHLRAWLAREGVGHVVDRPALRGLRSHFHDLVTLAHAARFGRRVRVHRLDGDEMRLRIFGDEHSEPAVAAAGLALELLHVFRREQLAVRIVQLLDESARRFLEHVRSWNRVDITLADERHHLLEEQAATALRATLKQEAASDHGDAEGADERDGSGARHSKVQRSG